MGIGLIKGKSALFLKEEVTEGTYVAPASAADAVEVLEDGLEFGTTREVIERNTLSATVESEAPRLGLKTVTGTIPTESNRLLKYQNFGFIIVSRYIFKVFFFF